MALWPEKLGLFARSPDARPLSEIAADIDAELAFHVEESARALTEAGLGAEAARAEALRRFGDYGRIRRECARTQMGERVMLQRIQVVMTGVLIAAVVVLVWSNHETRAAMQAERAQSMALLQRLEAQFGGADTPVAQNTESPLRSAPGVGGDAIVDRKPVRSASADLGDYLSADGRLLSFDQARDSWVKSFEDQDKNWRHGLAVAQRLASLPGAQGAEILASAWPLLSVEHREQAMKPFV